MSDTLQTVTLSAPTLRLGVTHTQYSLDDWADRTAAARGKALLGAAATYQNQHVMGWGASNPEPAPGVYDFARLDARVRLMRSTGARMVLTLAGAPDWMKGGQPGQTDWSRLDSAPTPDHYDDFARLAATVARRYPDVRYFQVWNELKGFWNTAENRWDYEGYTRLYNAVHDALKQVDPKIQVGGPYVVMDSWSSARVASHPSTVSGPWGVLDRRPLDVVDYWLAHSHGADFLAVDGGSATRDAGLITDEARANEKFVAVDAWLRSRTNLPIWWSELYPATTGGSATSARSAAVTLDALTRLAASGAAVALLWQPEARPDLPVAGLWTAPDRGGAQALPLATAAVWWRAHVRPGAALGLARSASGQLSALTADGSTLAVNLGTETVTADGDFGSVTVPSFAATTATGRTEALGPDGAPRAVG